MPTVTSGRTKGMRLRLPGRRVIELLLVAFIMSALTLVIGDLPELEVVESTVNDDTFSDLVITTRGELPIDTNIVILHFGPEILTSDQVIDRELLAQHLLGVMTHRPAVVAVDVSIEKERDARPVGDQMLASLIRDHRDRMMFGLFREDSLNRFRWPPPMFGLDSTDLGVINLMPEDDRVIRYFRKNWSVQDGTTVESFGVKAVRMYAPDRLARLDSKDAERYLIDYAGGIGEHAQTSDGGGLHVFPAFPIGDVTEALMTGDEETMRFWTRRLQDKLVLVGYADLRSGQVTSIVDRFYTPLKPEENSLPDMHGVAVHANIVNTILQGRIIVEVPAWINVLWGMVLVFLMYYGFEAFRRMSNRRLRSLFLYGGWVVLLAIALILPISVFRGTTWKLSVYTPFASLVLGRLALAVFDTTKRTWIDLLFRRRLKRAMPAGLRDALKGILEEGSPRERYVQALHVVQRLFHTSCDRLFSEAMKSELAFSRETVGAPTPARIESDLENSNMTLSHFAVDAAGVIHLLLGRPVLRRSLRVARSLVIAVNEIDRQTAALDEAERESESDVKVAGYGETVLSSAGGDESVDDTQLFVEIYAALDDFASEVADLLRNEDGSFRPLTAEESIGSVSDPFIVRKQCRIHGTDETFVYLCEQEDANNRDDYHDLIYAGETIHCRASDHPGLTQFRSDIRQSVVASSSGSEDPHRG